MRVPMAEGFKLTKVIGQLLGAPLVCAITARGRNNTKTKLENRTYLMSLILANTIMPLR